MVGAFMYHPAFADRPAPGPNHVHETYIPSVRRPFTHVWGHPQKEKEILRVNQKKQKEKQGKDICIFSGLGFAV